MRQFNNYEAVKVNSAEKAMEFLQYLEDNNTDFGLSLRSSFIKSTNGRIYGREYPIFFEALKNRIWTVYLESELEDKTKIIPLSEFLKPKVSYTREQAEKVLEDRSLFHNGLKILTRKDIAFLDHKFPKSTLEQVTEAVKDLGDFTIEQTSTGEIIISPIKITEE